MVAALAVLSLAGCTEQTGEAEAEVTYEVVGGISEPTRVWNEDNVEVEAEAPAADGEAYTPDVLAMEPTAFVTNKVADILTSDKDGEVVDTIEEGTELVLVGTTGKGYYQTEDGTFISASDVEKVVIEEQVAETETKPVTTQNNTTTTTQESQPVQQEQPAQQTEQPATEQTYEEPQQTEQPQQQEQPAQEQVAEQPSNNVQYDSNGEPSDINPVTGGVECEYEAPDAETQAWMDAHADGEVYEVGTYDDGAVCDEILD